MAYFLGEHNISTLRHIFGDTPIDHRNFGLSRKS